MNASGGTADHEAPPSSKRIIENRRRPVPAISRRSPAPRPFSRLQTPNQGIDIHHLPAKRALLALASIAAAAHARADIAWLDFQAPNSPLATLHQGVPAVSGTNVVNGPVTFTLVGEGLAARNREFSDPLLRDFAMVDGEGASITLRVAGLPAGNYIVESWHFDRAYPGALQIAYGKAGEAPQVLVPNHVFSTTPALYSIKSDGSSTYELTFKECNDDNRVRLNGLHLRGADEAESPPGIFVDIGYSNTTTVSGVPDPFFTTDATAPGFLNGPLWRQRTGYGLNMGGNRDIYEKDANDGVGNAAPLVTIARDLPVGATYGVYVGFLSIPEQNWQVKAGLSPDKLTVFGRNRPANRVIDLGRSAEPGSNRNQYLGFVGNATVGPDGALWLYSDDGDGTDITWSTRTWLDGFFLGAPRSGE